ncbi:MAG: hypothetical protein WBQ14_07495 [Gaiellaceae bacterium]
MPSIAERVYTFRAAGDLGDRIRKASAAVNESAAAERPDFAERIAAELVLTLARDNSAFRDASGNQSAFMRESVELLVNAATKVVSDLRYADLYAEAAKSRTDDETEFHRAGNALAAKRWHDA